jgi:hypothetical protein
MAGDLRTMTIYMDSADMVQVRERHGDGNVSQYIREAVAEKLERERERKDDAVEWLRMIVVPQVLSGKPLSRTGKMLLLGNLREAMRMLEAELTE